MRSANAFTGLARQAWLALLGALSTLYIAAPAYAFTPSQFPLLSASAVTPNVMLQVDNSGSMDTILLDAGYDPNFRYPTVYGASYGCFLFFCGYSQENAYNNNSDTVFLQSLSGFRGTARCSSSTYGFYKDGNSAVCLTLPDPAVGGATRYPPNYVRYLVAQAIAGKPVTVSTDSRMTTAISVATTLVANNLNLRMGLATFNPPVRGGDQGPGGRIQQEIVDLSAVSALGRRSAVTQIEADENASALTKAISELTAEANTPLAEAYYEVTRYFRGLRPFQGTGTANYTSPIQYRCQKNYGVVITDGLPTYDRTFPVNDPNDPGPTGNKQLPNWDQSRGDDGNNRDGDNEGDTLYLDDIAKFAFDIDMRTPQSTPPLDLADRDWNTDGFRVQNLRTYTVGFTTSNNMLSAAATYGQGQYYQASDKANLSAALTAALSDINAKAGSGGAGASSSATLQTGTQFYQTLYDPTDWHGTIKAFTLATDGGLDVSSAPAWNTDTAIAVGKTAPTYETWNNQGTGSAVALDYAVLSTAQKAAIDASRTNAGFSATGTTAVSGTDLTNWAKGINKIPLRMRTRLLGDIVNSPLAVALPNDKTAGDLIGDSSYTTYLAKKNSLMRPSIVVNANDGFMSVINTSDGARSYAYMPSTAQTAIATLATTTYGTSAHKFTVDGQVGVFDTQLSSGSAWQTIAVGGTGAGGKAFFAVRLFDGASSSPKALWEVRAPETGTNTFTNLGYTYAKPSVARLKNGAGVVIVGNGYGSSTGVASMFVLDVATGAVLREIVIPNSAGTDNGLSSVRLQVDGQNVVQAAYAGDLKGRLWKFDMSGGSVSSWKIAFNGAPLFTTPRGADQPITVQPLLYDHPTNGKLVYFGTGKFNEVADKTTTAQQDFYAIWDSTSGNGGYLESNLQAQSVTGTSTINGSQYVTTSVNEVDWASKKGWFLPLAQTAPFLGERIIYPAQTTRGRIVFTTAAVNSLDPCESTGTGRLFELDAEKGKMLSYPVLDTNGDGVINSSDQIVSGILFGAGLPNLAAIVSGSSSNPDTKYIPDSSGNIAVLKEKGGESTTFRRIMWRQIQ